MTSTPAQLRVLHLASWYPSQVHGTLGNFVERHIQSICTINGGEVWFATAVPSDQVVPANTVRDCGNYTERIFYFREKKPVVWQVTRTLLRAARESQPFDLIHLHVSYPAGRAARILSKRWKVPFILTEHWTAYHKDQSNALPFWRKRSMQVTGNAAHFVCPVTSNLGESMTEFGITRPSIPISNVVNTELFCPRDTPSNRSGFHALHISSLRDDQKNIRGMLRALQSACAQCDNLKVSIIGDGDPTPHQAYAKELGLEHRVEIGGEIDLSEVANRMRNSDALLLFSRFENFPCVIPEAWASGIPVLSTDVGGIKEHLTPERGALVQSEDEGAFASTLVSWANGAVTFDEQALRQYAVSHFGVEAIAKGYDRIYRTSLPDFPENHKPLDE